MRRSAASRCMRFGPSNIGLGETVVVIGLGLVGQLSRNSRGCRVAGSSRPTCDAERIELAARLGADPRSGQAAAAEIRSLTGGRGADCVIVAAAAKTAAPCLQALEMCADRGRLVIVGAVPLDFPWHEMYRKEISVLMSRAYGPGSYDPSYEQRGHDYPISYVRWTENRNMAEFLRLVRLGRVALAPLVTHVFEIDEAATAYRTILDPKANSVAVLLRYPTADTIARQAPISSPRAPRRGSPRAPSGRDTARRARRCRQPGPMGAPSDHWKDERRRAARRLLDEWCARSQLREALRRELLLLGLRRPATRSGRGCDFYSDAQSASCRTGCRRAAGRKARVRREADGHHARGVPAARARGPGNGQAAVGRFQPPVRAVLRGSERPPSAPNDAGRRQLPREFAWHHSAGTGWPTRPSAARSSAKPATLSI